MQSSENKIRLKIIPFVLFAGLIVAIFFINSWLINNLKESVTRSAKSYQIFVQKATQEAFDSFNNQNIKDGPTDIDLELFSNIMKEIDLSIIIKDIGDDGALYGYGDFKLKNKDKEFLKNTAEDMRKIFKPLPIKIDNKDTGAIEIHQELYYGDARMIKIIKLVPLVEIFIILSLLIIGWFIFHISKKNLQNAIYVGIFKETAHQLGTPISSLLGWTENIKDKGFDLNILEYINEDIDKLREISERFSKIGSNIKLSEINLSNLLDEIVNYSNKRIPATKDLMINSCYMPDVKVNGDKILLSWAFENLIKNSIDAIDKNSGKIDINVNNRGLKTVIDLSDTGKGIQRINWKRIFEPGYSTKKRGWGVGLSLTKRIIEKIHSGKIYILNSSKGKTVIRIIL